MFHAKRVMAAHMLYFNPRETVTNLFAQDICDRDLFLELLWLMGVLQGAMK